MHCVPAFHPLVRYFIDFGAISAFVFVEAADMVSSRVTLLSPTLRLRRQNFTAEITG